MKTALALPSGLALLYAHTAGALDNGLARTPPMGWMTWERFRCTADGGDVAGGGASQPSCAEDPENCISERLVRQHAEIMARPEWRGAGYEYLNSDDCWENWSRSPGGKLAPNSTRFPHGMRALADYVHSLGLKLGTYNDMGTETCGGYPGECKDESCSLPGYMGVDAATYAGAVRAAMLDAMPGARDWHDWDNRRMRDAWYGADAAAKD